MNVCAPLRGAILALAAVLSLFAAPAFAAQEVNVYSYRQPFLVKPLFDAFTEETGIPVNVVFAKKGLLERLKREGANSSADLLLTVDIGRLNDAVEANLVQPVDSATLAANVPAQYRHPQGLWYGLTTRARIIIASKERVKPGEITTYEDLADPKWKGRICTRSAKHVYMVALTAAMIAHHGTEAAEQWLRGVKANLARKPQGNDRAQAKAIKEGACDLALINTYYIGKMLKQADQVAWAAAVNIVFPNQQNRGTHVNISGVALTRSARNKTAAIKLMEFLSDNRAQQIYAAENYEYPVKAGVPWSALVASWGTFKADTLSLDKVAALRKEAVMLADRVGYDD
jgi:iron(III) transport system substrate-binding protein